MNAPTELPGSRPASQEDAQRLDQEAVASRWELLLPRFSLNRRVTVMVLMLTLGVLGAVATVSIPLELIPSGFSAPFLRVTAPWQDAPPEEVLDKVTLPLEEELSTVRGIDNMFSFARNGFTQIFMSFKHGTDMDVAYREVRDRVERARQSLPEDLEQVFIRKDDGGSIPVGMVGLAIEEGTTDVYDLIQNQIILPLERIEGVAMVKVDGLEAKEVLIELDRERVEAAGLNIFEIAQDLARDNFSMASGNVRAGDKKLLLRSVAKYRSPGAVEDLLVTPTVRLGDIASITYDEPEKEYAVRVNSRPAYAAMVMKEGEANTLEVATRVRDLQEKLRDNPRLRSMQIDMIMDQGEIIKDSLSTLLSSGRVGAIFAMIVLFFFLRRLRMSLIIALSIPLSMVVALVAMYFAGESLNVLSLLGLMISVGLLVDNSVVVAENIHRFYREENVSRREAAIRGAGEIAMAITTATLTTVIVFLPVSLVDGQGQFFLLRLAIPICVSLIASLFVALIFVPLSVYLTLPKGDEDETGVVARLKLRIKAAMLWFYEQTFGRLSVLYGKMLGYALRRRLDLVLALMALLGATSAVSNQVELVAMSEDEQAFFEIGVELPRSMTFEESEAYFRSAENRVAEVAEEVGLDFYMIFHRRNQGEVQGALSADRGDISPREVSQKILEVLPELPGIEFDTGQDSEQESEDKNLERLRLYGDDAVQLDEIAEDLEGVFAQLPGVMGVKKAAERAPNELALVIDRARAQKQGVNPQVLATMVGYALRGQALPRIYLGGRDIPVRVRYEERDRESLAQLGNFSVPNDAGEALALNSLVDVEQLPSATTIFRRDKQISRRMTLELEPGREDEARKAIYAFVGGLDLPEGVSFGPRKAVRSSGEAQSLAFAALLSIVFVYLLMGFLFESFLLPMAILVTIPLANIGVTWIHVLTGRDMDFLGIVGQIILIGVVVNNGIVLLDYVNRLRDRGMERFEALMLASERRFRPIMMTALTTICGMVPVTLGEATRMGLSYKSFGLTLIGGMVTASFLTLLVVPVCYTLFEDARSWVSRTVLGTLFGQRKEAADLEAGSASAGS
ncbi:MAG: efflux RND transporter permease subunit [Acidobacteriota bacterium]